MFNTAMRDQLSSLLGNNDQEQVQEKKSSKKKSKTDYLDDSFFSVNSEEKEFLNKHGVNVKKDNSVYKNQRKKAKDLLTSYRNSKTTNAYEIELKKKNRLDKAEADSREKAFKKRELEAQKKLKKEKAKEKNTQSEAAGSKNSYSNYTEGISKTEKFVEKDKANIELADKIGNDSTFSLEGAKADDIQSEKVSAIQKKHAQELAEETESKKLNRVLSGGNGVHETIDLEEGSTNVTTDSAKARIAAKGGIQAENGTFYRPIEGSHEEMVRKRADNIAKIRRGRYTKAGAVAVGALMATGSLVSALNSSRGQQSNAQLYGQQPLY